MNKSNYTIKQKIFDEHKKSKLRCREIYKRLKLNKNLRFIKYIEEV